MQIEIVTDCTGAKQDVIKRVFSTRFPESTLEITLVKGESFPTPQTWEDFSLTVLKRYQWMQAHHENPDAYFATIQKGYYYSRGTWFLTACAGIAYPMLNMLPVMASSVPLDTNCSKKKTKELLKNMSDIIKEEYPAWDKEKGSVYTFLTGEDEIPWLAQPLRHCLKRITSYPYTS